MTRLILFGFLLVASCGGPQASDVHGSGEDLSATGGVAEDGAGGEAGEGAPCDYGGAARMTCGSGLTCCYPESGEVAYGSCSSDCAD